MTTEQVRHRGTYRTGDSRKRRYLNVCMSDELREAVDEASAAAGLASGAWIRELIEDALDLHEEFDL